MYEKIVLCTNKVTIILLFEMPSSDKVAAFVIAINGEENNFQRYLPIGSAQ